MKTILIVISRGFLARNIITTGVLQELLKRPQTRIVFCVPKGTAAFLRKEVPGEMLVFEEYAEHPTTKLRKVLIFFLRYSTINRTTINLAWYGSGKARQYKWIYGLSFPFLFLIGIFPWSRSIFQYLEAVLFPDTHYDFFFKKYTPDLVLLTNIVGQLDIAFIKAARRHAVRALAMTKGWDNLDKYHMQIKADKLIVQAQPLREYASRYQGYSPADVFVGGFPAFDIYHSPETLLSRDEVCVRFGLDPTRKILFYGSEGVWSSNDDAIVEDIIRWMHEDAFDMPCSLILRPHFSEVSHHRFARFRGMSHVFVYDQLRLVPGFVDLWYPDADEVRLFASSIMHSDVMLCVRSTLTLDAIQCDRPVINFTTRAYLEKNGRDSTSNLYEHTFYRDLLRLGAVNLVPGDKDMIPAINACLKDPGAKSMERDIVRKVYCNEASEPSSHEKIAQYVLSFL